MGNLFKAIWHMTYMQGNLVELAVTLIIIAGIVVYYAVNEWRSKHHG